MCLMVELYGIALTTLRGSSTFRPLHERAAAGSFSSNDMLFSPAPTKMQVVPLELSAGFSPVGVELHAQVYSMLPQKAQVLAGARPTQHAEGALICWRNDDVNAPHMAVRRAEVAKDVIMPAQNSARTPVKAKLIATLEKGIAGQHKGVRAALSFLS